jgi:hypothetical protein
MLLPLELAALMATAAIFAAALIINQWMLGIGL